MSDKTEQVTKGIKNRVGAVRLRAIVLTIGIVFGLILYIFVNLITKQAMSWTDFCLLVVLQYLVYVTYFPEGENYGMKDAKYIRNYKAYNAKASQINKMHRINKLREFCKVDYQRRRKAYIETECGMLDITLEELEQLKKEDEKTIKTMKTYSFKTYDEKGEITGEKLVKFSKHKRKRIYALIFKPLPVEENHAETIMSAVENNGMKAIRNEAPAFKTTNFILKAFQVVLTAVILAYIGYQSRDGIGLEEVFRMFVYLFTIVANATTAYTTGEACTKVYRNRFHVKLVNFIDEFNEWGNFNDPVQSEEEEKDDKKEE